MVATRKADADLDFSGIGKIIRALHNPVTSDPGSPADGEIWYRTDTDKFRGRLNGVTDSFAMIADVTAGGVSASLWDAFSVVTADTDNTPQATTLGASTVLGRRASGGIVAISYANLKSDLALNNVPNTDATARANHTGSQASSTISDFSTAVDARITAFVGAAPTALDTLDELAAALGDDPNFAATMATALGLRTKKFSGNYGNASATTFTVNHALATTDVTVSVRLNSTGAMIDAQVVVTDANNVTVDTNTVYALNAIRVVVVG